MSGAADAAPRGDLTDGEAFGPGLADLVFLARGDLRPTKPRTAGDRLGGVLLDRGLAGDHATALVDNRQMLARSQAGGRCRWSSVSLRAARKGGVQREEDAANVGERRLDRKAVGEVLIPAAVALIQP
jgi:hypothetical protein